MTKASVLPNRGAAQIKRLLASPEFAALIADLEATRWTGRPGYPIRTMVGMTLVIPEGAPLVNSAEGTISDSGPGATR